MKALKGYKTILFNVIMGAGMFYAQVTGETVNTEGLLAHITGLEAFVTTTWASGNVWLRAVTNTKIFSK